MTRREPEATVNLKVRMSEAMRVAIEKAAKANHRSMNSEIVHRLAISFGAGGIGLVDQYKATEQLLRQMIRTIIRKTRQ